jgi:hypothetical protein
MMVFFFIEHHIAIADIVVGRNRAADNLSGAMLPVVAARFHAVADRGRTPGRSSPPPRKTHRFKGWRLPGKARREPHQFAPLIESRQRSSIS